MIIILKSSLPNIFIKNNKIIAYQNVFILKHNLLITLDHNAIETQTKRFFFKPLKMTFIIIKDKIILYFYKELKK